MSIRHAAIIPAAPLLIPTLTGQVAVAQEVRTAALTALQGMFAPSVREVVIVAEAQPAGWHAADRPRRLDRLGGWGPRESGDALPVPLALGLQLVSDAGWSGATRLLAVDSHSAAPELTSDCALVVMGNGSACCTPKAPGSFREDAVEFNATLLDTVRSTDVAAMRAFDAADAAEQLSDIAMPLQVLGASLDPSTPASLHFAGEWGGVFYVCATYDASKANEGES